MPPTMAATLTSGGFLGRLDGSATRLPSICSSASLSLAGTGFRQSLRCDDTCKASSRVGARMRARSRRLVDTGPGCDNM